MTKSFILDIYYAILKTRYFKPKDGYDYYKAQIERTRK